ncbi:MAG: PfkB family carbohydrate kinase [Ferruginibacter sp.]
MDFDKLFEDISKLKVAVIGDVMLDTYWWGHVERISPEAPVPVVAVDKKEQRIGGAANVALNISSMNAAVFAISVMGDDDDGMQLKQLLDAKNINTSYLIQSKERTTTNKIRIISRNQQMMRLDAEMTKDISTAEEDELIKAFENFVAAEKPNAVILEDYNKGVLTPKVIEKVIAICKANHIITAVDPKRKNFFAYKGVDIFKPNLKEAKEAFNIISDNVDLILLEAIHLQLHEKIQHNASYITLSEKGVFYQQGDHTAIIPSHIRNVADVSGAGDTVIAVAALVYAATGDIALMAAIANIAGGLVCEVVGTAAIDRELLLEECKRLLTPVP